MVHTTISPGMEGAADRRVSGLTLVDHFEEVVPEAWENAALLDGRVPRRPSTTEPRRADQVVAERRDTQGLRGGDQQIAALVLVLVAGNAWLVEAGGRGLLPGDSGLPIALPGEADRLEPPLAPPCGAAPWTLAHPASGASGRGTWG